MGPVIIIGIDFGTTYSGVAWAYSKQPDDIKVITNWESELSRCSDLGKTPSRLEFARLEDVKRWGYGIPLDKEVVQWFKLLLLKRQDLPTNIVQTAQYATLLKTKDALRASPVDIVARFLRLLWDHSVKTILSDSGSSMVERCRFQVVITTPAIWPHYVQDTMRLAAKMAGILDARRNKPTTLDFISEPEAATLATLRKMKDGPDIETGDTMIVCDAGGGTADLISYTIDSVDPLGVRECVSGQGGLCGGIFVDQNFESLIESKVGVQLWSTVSVADKRRFLNDDWECGIKTQFENQDRDWYVQVPEATEETGPRKRKRTQMIELESHELVSVFSPVVGKICKLVGDQVKGIAAAGLSTPKFIILVGGFGACRYLYKRLVDDYPGIVILQPKQSDSWTAICQGAVMHGITHLKLRNRVPVAVKSRLARFSYGIATHIAWKANLYEEQDKFWDDVTSCWRAANQMIWLLTKGTSLEVGQKTKHCLYRAYTGEMPQIEEYISYCASDKPPKRRNDDVQRLCKFKWNTSLAAAYCKPCYNTFNRTYYYQIDYHINVTIEGPTLGIQIVCGDATIADGNVSIEYD